MRITTILGVAAAVALVAALAYLVKQTAAGHEDWLELVAIAAATLALGAVLFTRRAPRRNPSPILRRTPESDW